MLQKGSKESLLQYRWRKPAHTQGASGQPNKTNSDQCKVSGIERDQGNGLAILRLHRPKVVRKVS